MNDDDAMTLAAFRQLTGQAPAPGVVDFMTQLQRQFMGPGRYAPADQADNSIEANARPVQDYFSRLARGVQNNPDLATAPDLYTGDPMMGSPAMLSPAVGAF